MVQLLYPGITKGAGARPPQLVQRDQAAPAFIESFRAVVDDDHGMIAPEVSLHAPQVLVHSRAQDGADTRRRRSVTSRTATGSRASTAPPAPRSSTAWLVRTSSGGAELAHAQCHAQPANGEAAGDRFSSWSQANEPWRNSSRRGRQTTAGVSWLTVGRPIGYGGLAGPPESVPMVRRVCARGVSNTVSSTTVPASQWS